MCVKKRCKVDQVRKKVLLIKEEGVERVMITHTHTHTTKKTRWW